MNVTREVIADLWPLVAAGEASTDSRALVDEFLRGDPAFAQELKVQDAERLIGGVAPALPPSRESQALAQTKRALHGHDWLLFAAMMATAQAFARIVADTSWDVSPRVFIFWAVIAAGLWAGYWGRAWWVRRKVYRGGGKL
jgi:hypothetical protein